jgi:D-beta-D-heptose 7-phosphate kinase/D-beta-D-heptose 1-phosphate adenosyltransferase
MTTRLIPPSKKIRVAISGGFDPVHVGHVRMIAEAAKYGSVVIIANSDEWLMRKKGYVFMSWDERQEILCNFKGVTEVVKAQDDDGTVCRTLATIKPDYFANGGDRKDDNTPEVELCHHLDIEMLWNIGGEKIQSSSELVTEANKKERRQNGIKF